MLGVCIVDHSKRTDSMVRAGHRLSHESYIQVDDEFFVLAGAQLVRELLARRLDLMRRARRGRAGSTMAKANACSRGVLLQRPTQAPSNKCGGKGVGMSLGRTFASGSRRAVNTDTIHLA